MMEWQGSLTEDQALFYHNNGYLVLEGFTTENECKELMRQMEDLVEKFDPSTISVFSSRNLKKTDLDDYFCSSANNISFFFEEKAFDENGELRQPKSLSLNKVGHALHELDPVFRRFSRSSKIATVFAGIGYKSPLLVQSMYIFKQPGIGGEVLPHQDSTFLYTDPPLLTGLWFAFEDATVENGCLWVLPGSHKDGVVRRFVKAKNGFIYDKELPGYKSSEFVPLEVKAGALVILHGSVVHQSFPNLSEKSRHAYTLHAIEKDNCTWSPLNWLQHNSDVYAEPIFSYN